MWGIFYNELFNSLIAIKQQQNDAIVELQEGLTLIKDEKTNEVIGFNLFNVDEEILIHQAFNSFNKPVIDFLKTKLSSQFEFNQESQFIVGNVVECEPIPDTHLHLTKVNVGQEVLQIVCGAKNIAKDQYVVVALVGAWMPNGSQILDGKLRGFESSGMIVSAKELELGDHDFNLEGIIELPDQYQSQVGNDFFALYQQQ